MHKEVLASKSYNSVFAHNFGPQVNALLVIRRNPRENLDFVASASLVKKA
jgi:hypothetical protein